jgi:hypothetical protein
VAFPFINNKGKGAGRGPARPLRSGGVLGRAAGCVCGVRCVAYEWGASRTDDVNEVGEWSRRGEGRAASKAPRKGP